MEFLVTPDSESNDSADHVWIPVIEILVSRVFQEFISSLPLFEILSGGTEKVRERYQLVGPHISSIRITTSELKTGRSPSLTQSSPTCRVVSHARLPC